MTGQVSDPGRSGRAIADARAAGRAALVGYLPVGYPSVSGSVAAMQALVESGCDIVEVGIPYSDPVMDGHTIQHAAQTALDRGVRVRDVFTAVEAVAAAGAVPVSMTYWNLVERYGVRAFARDFAQAGGAGLITPDLTPDEAEEWFIASDEYGLERIFLVSPSSTDERIRLTADACRGWMYVTSVMGVTGTRATTSQAGSDLIRRVREIAPDRLIGLGLGVSNGEQAREIAQQADAVIVGSALVRTLIEADERGTPDDLDALRALTRELAAGMADH